MTQRLVWLVALVAVAVLLVVGGVVFAPQLQYSGTVAAAPDGGVIATGIGENDDGFSAVRFRPDLGVNPPTAWRCSTH